MRSHQDILDAIWETLNIARDDKALVIARAGTIININPQAARLCGRSVEELVGGKVTAELFDGSSETAVGRWETALKTPAGDLIAVEVIRQALGAHLPEIEVYAIRDLRDRHKGAAQDRAIARLAGMFAALSAANETILRTTTQEELYQQVCEAALRGGNFVGTAILLHDPKTDLLEVIAGAGQGIERLRLARISVAQAAPQGQGLAGTAFRTRKPCISNDFMNDERSRAWRDQVQDAAIGAAAALPLLRGDCTIGVLLVYLNQPGALDDDIVALLMRMAENLSFALHNLDRNAERKRSEKATRRLARMFAALSATNEAILRAATPDELYQLVCDASVHGGKSLATAVLLVEPDSHWLRPVAGTGEIIELVKQSRHSIDPTNPYGKGVCGNAFRTREPFVNKDVLNSEQARPWRESGPLNGVVACAALPLVKGGHSIGVLMFFISKSWAEDEEIIALLQRMAENVSFGLDNFDQEEKRKQAEARANHLAMHDALTGLANRIQLNGELEHALARVKRGEIIATHLLDLDHFKNVNDTLGHPAGDKLLNMVADRLRSAVRETDIIARMGGDEFAILQVDIAQPADVSALAVRVIDSVNQPYDIDGHQVIIGTSVGVAVAPTDGTGPDQLMRNADLALYRAKGDGRGTFRFFQAGMDAQMRERRAMECDLRKALAVGEFELYYQPVVNLLRNEISGVEALIRWWHPERGLLLPSAFIPVAEEIGFIIPLGEWVLRKACATAAQWPGHVRVSVNLSPLQFDSPGLVQIVLGALGASGLAPARLELEITETALLKNTEVTLSTLYQLREIGVRIAIDDFGTGYSSLSYLQSFPFDNIKIDRSFVKDINEGVGSLNIVRAVAALANGLGMATTAEGVETSEQLDTIKSEGCTEMQGFFFSAPRPAGEIERLFFPPAEKTEEILNVA